MKTVVTTVENHQQQFSLHLSGDFSRANTLFGSCQAILRLQKGWIISIPKLIEFTVEAVLSVFCLT